MDGYDELSTINGYWAGVVASFITSFVIGWLLKYVAKHDFKIFAYYRIILGLLILISLLVLDRSLISTRLRLDKKMIYTPTD